MTYLIDTNVVLRIVEPHHPMHAAAAGAIKALLHQGEQLVVFPQIIYEFWVASTRPVNQNGLGFSVAQATNELSNILMQFPLLDDMASVFHTWRGLVASLGVAGKEAHDARLVAAMTIRAITHILTFNTSDFQRYPGISAIAPDDVIKGLSPTP